jgi:hypothetical protein
MIMFRNIPGVPDKGWRVVDVIDLGDGAPSSDTYETCENCGHPRVRYVFILEHDDHPDPMRVGCCCAENMSEGYAVRAREAALKSRSRRKPE